LTVTVLFASTRMAVSVSKVNVLVGEGLPEHHSAPRSLVPSLWPMPFSLIGVNRIQSHSSL